MPAASNETARDRADEVTAATADRTASETGDETVPETPHVTAGDAESSFDDRPAEDYYAHERTRDDYGSDSSDYSSDSDSDYVDRANTLIRLLYTLLFLLISRVVEAAVGVIVLFQLGFAFVTNSRPNPAVNGFARRVIEYGYQIAHYITYNREQPPFPFDEFPDEPESPDGPHRT